MIVTIFKTHCYSFGGVWYIQSNGGTISLGITNAVSKIRIAHWATSVQRLLRENKIVVLLALYDYRWLFEQITKGMVWDNVNNTLRLCSEQLVTEKDKPQVQKTQEIMLDIMNSVFTHIELTVENQFAFHDNMLPLLDFAMHLQKHDNNYTISYKF